MDPIKIVQVFKAGTKAKATKVIAFGNSDVKVGNVLKGVLRTDVKVGQNISFVDSGNTSTVVAVNATTDGGLIVTTGTSIYLVQVVK